VLLRPRDVPGIARSAGRALGAGVRLLRESREAALRAASDSSADVPNTYVDARRMFSQSVRSLDDISQKLRQEIAPLSFIPRSLIETNTENRPVGVPLHKVATDAANNNEPERNISGGVHMTERNIPLNPSGTHTTGADIIASVIEDSALAKQQARLFGSSQSSQ
jgi:hypothetical protein